MDPTTLGILLGVGVVSLLICGIGIGVLISWGW